MKVLIDAILQGYGSLVTVTDGESARTFRALVRPVTEKGWQNTRRLFGPLGEVQKGQYVFIGPADAAVSCGQTVTVREEKYLVRRCETAYLGDEAVYVWALLVKAEGDGVWNS